MDYKHFAKNVASMASEGKTSITGRVEWGSVYEGNIAGGAMVGRPRGGRAGRFRHGPGASCRGSIPSIHAAPQSESREIFSRQ